MPPVPDQVAGSAVAADTGLYWSEGPEGYGRLAIEPDGAVWKIGQFSQRLRVSGTDRKLLLGNGPASITLRPDKTILFRSGNGESSVYTRVADWTPTAADRAAMVGRYYSPELDVTYELRATGDSVFVERRKFQPIRLVPLFKDTFTSTNGGAYRILRGRDGKVTGMTAGSGRVVRVEFVRLPAAK